MNEKFIKKYLRMAKQVGEDSNPCYARQIGAIIVHPIENRILGTGYNGPPAGTPHCDTVPYLQEIVWPQLTNDEKDFASVPASYANDKMQRRWFLEQYGDCKRCPRRIVGAPSGKRPEICSCVHSEINAIINARQSVFDCHLIGWCGLPCIGCSTAIINAGIKKIICLKWKEDYSFQSRQILSWAQIVVEERDEESLEVV